jgi:peptidoglycan/xylan/chitin deacetylase (PgdA/CDA1 family)
MASTLHSTGGDRLLGNMAGAHGDPLILCYHRVVEDFAAHARTTIPSMLVSRRMLAQHLDWVGRRYRFVSLDDLLTRLRSGEPFAQPVAAVTFDDGYHDVYEHGLDVLREKGVPGAVYVVTDVIERGRLQVFDHLYLLLVRAQSTRRDLREALSALETSVRAVLGPRLGDPMAATQHLLTSLPQPDLLRVIATLEAHIPLDAADLAPLRPLTWDEVIRMHRAGVVIGSHTRRHQLLNHLAPDAVTDELVNSRRELERWLRAPVRHFAYPGGWFNAGVVQAVADAGYEMAVTTCRHRDSAHPRLTVPRRTAWEHASVDATFNFAPAVMGCYVNGVFDVARRCTLDHRGSPTPSPTGPAPAEARDAVAR